jgi:hypothetical protein
MSTTAPITINWKSTGAKCTTFRTIKSLARWLSTAGGSRGVTKRQGTHPSVDLRDVTIPPDAESAAWDHLD